MRGSWGLGASSGLKHSVWVALVLTAVVSLVVLAFWATGLGWSESLRDARLSDAPMAGFISNIGIGAMFVAAFSALISLAFGGSARHFVLGLYCLVFALDDALLLHERLGAL